ncbi:MAG TPA: hypothetical protein VKI45_01190 [Allosphingosinicella sp.]|nr:hypothetical protein [Allosphingosinicella sp.]
MRDAMEARMWAEHGHAFSDAVAAILASAWAAMKTLNRIEFDAPWEHGAGTGRPSGRA